MAQRAKTTGRARLPKDTAGGNDLAEFEQFLKRHPKTQFVDAFISDLCSTIRGKRLPVHEAAKIWQSGVQMPFCLYFLDVTGEDLDPGQRSEARGDPDGSAWPVAGTLQPVPWAEVPTAQVLLTMPDQVNQPCRVDPRQVLGDLVARFKQRGLTPMVAVEMEFYLTDRKRGGLREPLPPISPATGLPDTSRQLYSISNLDVYGAFIRDVAAAATAQAIPASTAITENSPGQFEINLYHSPDALLAADHAVLLKRVIREIAKRHGHEATFMAKPFLQQAGSGMHIHCSLLDDKGRNVFDDGSDEGGPVLRQAVAGLAATMGEAMALFAPNLNSYRRYQPGSLVPMAPTWGANNRSVAFRIPLSNGKARRIEHRIAGADANPHLVVAGILAGMLHGIEGKLTPPAISVGDVSQQRDAKLPFDWMAALDRLAKAKVLPDYLGAGYLALYVDAKRAELEKFQRRISPQEYDWYL
ncbi:MAG: glutamine synthetase [Rhodospirillaceae bacterium]|nr:MAG: glutamine synthetase [Rhodospirillaceae bacterium]